MTFVSTSAFYDRFNLNMGSLRREAVKLQAAIGSGERLERSSDDPVAASRLRKLARADGFAAVDMALAARASADLALTDSALQSFASSLIRVQELATQAANGVLTASQRAGIATEIEAIAGELVRLANTRDSAGHALFGGDTAGDAYVLDGAGNAVYIGTATASELPLGDGQSVTRGPDRAGIPQLHRERQRRPRCSRWSRRWAEALAGGSRRSGPGSARCAGGTRFRAGEGHHPARP
jgi:flagellar hook-associated protein 3 FlgL